MCDSISGGVKLNTFASGVYVVASLGCKLVLWRGSWLQRCILFFVAPVHSRHIPAVCFPLVTTGPRSALRTQPHSSDNSNRVSNTWREHNLVRKVDGRVVHRWQHNLLATSSPPSLSDSSHGNDPHMHNNTGSCQVTWNQTEGRKGVVLLSYSQDDIRNLGVCLCNNETRDGFYGKLIGWGFNGRESALRH